jgi:hypothetical protein
MWLKDVIAGIGLLLFMGACFAMAAILPAFSAYS